MLSRKNTLNAMSIILTVSALFFGISYLSSLVSEISDDSLEFNYLLIALSVILFICFYILLSIHWNRVCKFVENKQENQVLSFFASQPYKYLPTSLFTFSFRAKYAKDLGMGIKKSSIAQLIENFNMLSTGLLVGSLFYLVYTKFVLLAVFIFLLIILLLSFIPNRLRINIKSREISINKKEQIINMSLAATAWGVSGISFYVLSKGLGVDISVNQAVSSSALAYVLGILAFFAPGGIGIREWVFAIFSVSSVTVLGWRILTFIADLLLGFFAILIIARKKKKSFN